MTIYIATLSVPGYLPMDDDPPAFDNPSEAWSYLAEGRRFAEDMAGIDEPDDTPYSNTVDQLDANASAGLAEGTVYGDTPGYDGDHDLGIAYSVTQAEDTPERN